MVKKGTRIKRKRAAPFGYEWSGCRRYLIKKTANAESNGSLPIGTSNDAAGRTNGWNCAVNSSTNQSASSQSAAANSTRTPGANSSRSLANNNGLNNSVVAPDRNGLVTTSVVNATA